MITPCGVASITRRFAASLGSRPLLIPAILLVAWPAFANLSAAGDPVSSATDSGSDLQEVLPEIGPLQPDMWAGPILPAEREALLFREAHPFVEDVFIPGERLVFSVRYGLIRAGVATLWIEDVVEVKGHSCYHIVSKAESNDFFSAFFHVRDRVESFMDVNTLLPRRFEKHLNEGEYRNHEIVEMDHRNQTALYNGQEAAALWPTAHDVLSAFYDVRARSLVPGEVIYIDSHAGRKNYALEVHVRGREHVRVPAGEFDCVVVEPLLRTPGLFKHEGALTIWLTDDERHVPVQMKSSLPIGAISVILTDVVVPKRGARS